MRLLAMSCAVLSVAVALHTCPCGVHIIACSGHGGGPHKYGLLEGLVESVTAQIPDSTNHSLPYPKKDENYPAAVAAGVTLLTKRITKFASRCPDTPIVLLGYSEGAIVLMNTLCGRSHAGAPFSKPLPRHLSNNILATVAYGDETFVSNQTYDRGTCTKGYGVDRRMNPNGCRAFESNIRSYCDAADPRCCGGTRPSAHFGYPKRYDDDATQFVVRKYNKKKN